MQIKTQAAEPAQSLWETIGSAWVNKDKKGRQILGIVFGDKQNPITSFSLQANERIVLRENTNQRKDSRDPDFQVCLVKS